MHSTAVRLLLARSIVSLDTSIPLHTLCWQQLGSSTHLGRSKFSSSGSSSSSADKPDVLSTASPASSASILNKYVSQDLVTDVSSTINRLTGYEGIDRLKARVATVDEALTDCKKQLQAAKLAYDQQLSHQAQLHREVTALLQRKSSWVPADVARFTELYAAEHETEQAVAAAKARYTGLSDDVELLQLKMVDLIRERYQQEQAWSDKIRRASTWWTWGLMGLQFASFVAVYTVLEPRKRQALTDAVSTMLQQHTATIDTRLGQFMGGVRPAGAAAARPAGGGSREQAAADSRQQQQQEDGGGSQLLGTEVQHDQQQQRVLQELEKVQQQLSALAQAQQQQQQVSPAPQAGTSSNAAGQAAGASWWQQLPSKQWLAQQASAAGAAAARGWQAVSKRGGQLQATFNPMQSLGGSQQEREGGSPQPADAAATGSPSSSSQQQPQVQQQEPSQAKQEDCAGDLEQQQQPRSRSLQQLLGQLQAGGGGVVEVTRGQLAALGAAASAAGAALGAVLVVVLSRSGSGGGGAAAGGGR